MKNVEIKAKVSNVKELIERARALSDSYPTEIIQHDSFFQTNQGRLKLRKFQNGNAELIYYERPDQEGPKMCSYEKCPIVSENVDGLTDVLTRALGKTGIVKKTRQLFLVDQTRIHVDSVENLGDFMELEVGLKTGQTLDEGEAIAYLLMEKLGVKKEDLLSGAYTDMLNAKGLDK